MVSDLTQNLVVHMILCNGPVSLLVFRNTDEKMVRVCFHALLQGDIEEKKERLVLMSGDTQFGGWRYTNNKVELKR